MKNYLLVNAFVKDEKFERLYKRLIEEFKTVGEEVEILTNASALKLVDEKCEGAPILFWDKDVNLGSLLQKWGYKPVNSPKAIEICDDKAKTFLYLEGVVAMPETIIAPFTFDSVGYENFEFLDFVIQKLGFPMVVKQTKGSFGERVYLARDRQEIIEILRTARDGVIFQKYVGSSHGKDYRVYVVGGKVIAAALRENKHDFRSNVALGGSMHSVPLPLGFEEVAISALERTGASFGGVDLLIGDNGEPLLCEVNTNAHFEGLEKCTGINVAREIVKFYLSLKG